MINPAHHYAEVLPVTVIGTLGRPTVLRYRAVKMTKRARLHIRGKAPMSCLADVQLSWQY